MKNIILLSLYICCLSLSKLYAKNNDTSIFYKNEINVFAGYASWEQTFAVVGEGLFNFSNLVDTGFSVSTKFIHPVGITYKHYFKKMWCLTSSFSYARTFQTHTYTNPNFSFKKYDNIFSLMIGAECHYLNKKWVSLYSGLAIGGFLWQNRVDNKDGINKTVDGYVAFQVNALGIRVGKRFGGFLELGFGNSGIINGGFSIKF
ncbi:MAG: hypothetical protein U0T07_00470 [Chitinophagales bacterium]